MWAEGLLVEVLGGVKQGQHLPVKFLRESMDFFYFQTEPNICSIEPIHKHNIPACRKKKKKYVGNIPKNCVWKSGSCRWAEGRLWGFPLAHSRGLCWAEQSRDWQPGDLDSCRRKKRFWAETNPQVACGRTGKNQEGPVWPPLIFPPQSTGGPAIILLLHPSNSQYVGNSGPCNPSSPKISLLFLGSHPISIPNINLFCYTHLFQERVAPLLPLYKSIVRSLPQAHTHFCLLHYKKDTSALTVFLGQMLWMIRNSGSVEQVQGNGAVI